jgi:hypothetical protein
LVSASSEDYYGKIKKEKGRRQGTREQEPVGFQGIETFVHSNCPGKGQEEEVKKTPSIR